MKSAILALIASAAFAQDSSTALPAGTGINAKASSTGVITQNLIPGV